MNRPANRTATAEPALAELAVPAITRKTLALFAGASGDHQPTHIDIDAARAKGRPDVIAHGMLIMAYLSRLLVGLAPQERIRSFSTRFVAQTPVHAEVRCAIRLEERHAGLVRYSLTACLADGTVVARGEASVAEE